LIGGLIDVGAGVNMIQEGKCGRAAVERNRRAGGDIIGVGQLPADKVEERIRLPGNRG
jgi:hypothetical protein